MLYMLYAVSCYNATRLYVVAYLSMVSIITLSELYVGSMALFRSISWALASVAWIHNKILDGNIFIEFKYCYLIKY